MSFTIHPAKTEEEIGFFLSHEYKFSKENGMIDEKETYEKFKDELMSFLSKKQKTGIFLAKHESGALIGYIWVSNRGSSEPWDSTKDPAWIFDIQVNSDYRRRGIGKALIKQAELWATNEGFDRLGLHVFGHNKSAINLYKANGFRDVNYYTQKTVKQHKSDRESKSCINIREVSSSDDKEKVMNLVRKQFQDIAQKQQELGEEELESKFQSLKNEIKTEHITYVAEDLENDFLGFFWAYKSKGDLGKKSYVWLLDIGVVPKVKEEKMIILDLLQKLEEETTKLELDTIRTSIHCSNKEKSLLFKDFGYEISNHFMYKSL